MPKKILITGATDGIGLETAKILCTQGHHLLIHGRSPEKLAATKALLESVNPDAAVRSYQADLSKLDEVNALAKAIQTQHGSLDVLINNAGVLRTPVTTTEAGPDVRFVVNTIAPYVLTQQLLPLLPNGGRVVNLSSAAQQTLNFAALTNPMTFNEPMAAYAQSKLAITAWSHRWGVALKDRGIVMVAVNPGSLLASKMVKEGFGIEGNDLQIGADILVRAALSEEFSDAYGAYYDNDAKRFATPHIDALNPAIGDSIIEQLNRYLPI